MNISPTEPIEIVLDNAASSSGGLHAPQDSLVTSGVPALMPENLPVAAPSPSLDQASAFESVKSSSAIIPVPKRRGRPPKISQAESGATLVAKPRGRPSMKSSGKVKAINVGKFDTSIFASAVVALKVLERELGAINKQGVVAKRFEDPLVTALINASPKKRNLVKLILGV